LITIIGMESLQRHSFQSSDDAWQKAKEYGIDIAQLEFLIALSPAERLRRHDMVRPLILAARQAGIQYYGFDPRPPETAE
jgi:hypothetical protein